MKRLGIFTLPGRCRFGYPARNEALLRVGNLAWRVDRYELLDLFSKAGRVRRCEVICDRFTLVGSV
jgi:hypothetical protein